MRKRIEDCRLSSRASLAGAICALIRATTRPYSGKRRLATVCISHAPSRIPQTSLCIKCRRVAPSSRRQLLEPTASAAERRHAHRGCEQGALDALAAVRSTLKPTSHASPRLLLCIAVIGAGATIASELPQIPPPSPADTNQQWSAHASAFGGHARRDKDHAGKPDSNEHTHNCASCVAAGICPRQVPRH